MTRVRFAQGLHLWLQNHEYIIKEKAKDKFQLFQKSTGQITEFTEKELIQYFFANQLTFKNPSEKQSVNSYQEADYSQLSDSLKAEAQRLREVHQNDFRPKVRNLHTCIPHSHYPASCSTH